MSPHGTRTRIVRKYRDRFEQWGVEYVFPGILATAAIIAGVVLLVFVDGVFWSGWAAIAWGVFMLLLSRLMWLNDGP